MLLSDQAARKSPWGVPIVAADGGTLFSPLPRDAAGNLYDTGEMDGDFGNGIFFKLNAQTEEGLRRDLVLQPRT